MSRAATHETVVAVGRIIAGRVSMKVADLPLTATPAARRVVVFARPQKSDTGTVKNQSSSAVCGIKSSDIWEAARRLGLYGKAAAELDAMIVQHLGACLLVDRVTAAAAQYVHDLRRASAAGDPQ